MGLVFPRWLVVRVSGGLGWGLKGMLLGVSGIACGDQDR